MNGILMQDVHDMTAKELTSISQAERRSLVRSAAASIESCIFFVKQLVLMASKRTEGLTVAEKLIIEEKAPVLHESGKASMTKAKCSFLSNLKFAFKVFCRIYGIPLPASYERMLKSVPNIVAVRDRITHPKKLTDMTVTDEESLAVIKSYQLFILAYADMVAGALNKSKREAEVLREELLDQQACI